MPSPSTTTASSSKKERFARFISRLRSKRTASGSSLVLQAGFPTSLADLVVKNRDKFKKRRKHSSLSSDLDSAASPSAPAPSESDSGDVRRVSVVESPHPVDEVAPVARRGGLGLGFFTVKAAALVVVAVGRKWVVVGVTVLTFGLVVIEKIRSLKSRSKGEERFDLRGRELASPIREIECESHQDNEMIDAALIESEGKFGFSGCSDSRSDHSSERRDFDAADHGLRKSKKKKLFKRLFGKKSRPKRDEGSSGSTASLDDSRASHDEVYEISDDETYLSCEEEEDLREISEIQSRREVVDVNRDEGNEIRLRRWRKLVFFVVVLLGLLGGKGAALLLTVAWFLLSGYTGNVLKRWKMQRIDRIVS